MSKAPAFQLYAKDILSDTLTWTAQELGVYMRLLMWSWDNGPIPEDPMRRDRIDPDCSQCWTTVATKWQPDGNGGLTNPRLEKTRAEMDAYRQRQSDRGKRSAEARAKKPRRNKRSTGVETPVQPVFQPEGQPNFNNKAGVGADVGRDDQGGKERANDLPFASPAFAEAVARWERHRAEIKHKLTPEARKAWLKKCEAMGEAAAIAAIDHSIANGWTGMFPPKTEDHRPPAPHQSAERKNLVTDWDYKSKRA